jgi:hypothetical protein
MSISSDVAICNNALLRIGASTITSLDDGTTSSNILNQVYEPTRDSLLRKHFWNFATKRVALAADSVAPAFEWQYSYPLPSDFIRMNRIYNVTSPYKIEGTNLLTDQAAPLNIVYIARITDPTQFDPLFVEILTLTLAVKIANRLGGDGYNVSVLYQELSQMMNSGQMVDAQDDSPDALVIDTFTNARYGLFDYGWTVP